MDDLTLLHAFEPVVHFTRGELFFPTYADEYVRLCSLWLHDDDGDRLLVAEGELTADKLAEFADSHAGQNLYLRFVGASGIPAVALAPGPSHLSCSRTVGEGGFVLTCAPGPH
jgi:hypothetical protein